MGTRDELRIENAASTAWDTVLNDLLASKEELERVKVLQSETDQRGISQRKSGTMSPETREALAERMRRYWDSRRSRVEKNRVQ